MILGWFVASHHNVQRSAHLTLASIVPQAKIVLDEVLEKLPDVFDVADVRSRVDEFTPYIMVAIQVNCPRGPVLFRDAHRAPSKWQAHVQELVWLSQRCALAHVLLLIAFAPRQETERMNVLLARIRSTLAELDLGLKGDLTMSEPMERLMQARSVFQRLYRPVPWPYHHRP